MISEETKQQLILTLLGLNGKTPPKRFHKLIGKICMFRTYSAGVHFGELVSKDGKECTIKNARRVHYWKSACSLSQLAMEGSKDIEECRISVPVNEIVLTEVIEIIPMTDAAVENLKGHVWKS